MVVFVDGEYGRVRHFRVLGDGNPAVERALNYPLPSLGLSATLPTHFFSPSRSKSDSNLAGAFIFLPASSAESIIERVRGHVTTDALIKLIRTVTYTHNTRSIVLYARSSFHMSTSSVAQAVRFSAASVEEARKMSSVHLVGSPKVNVSQVMAAVQSRLLQILGDAKVKKMGLRLAPPIPPARVT